MTNAVVYDVSGEFEGNHSWEKMIAMAEAGDQEMIEYLVDLYGEGGCFYDDEQGEYVSIEIDVEKDVYWNRKGAEFGYSNNMFNLGLYYAKGYGVERDFSLAIEWMKKAIAAGDEDAKVQLKEYSNILEWKEKAEAGDPKAQGLLATGYMGLGPSLWRCGGRRDYEEAFKWADLAMGKDDGEAYLVYGLAYAHERGVDEIPELAAYYFRKGAEMGNVICINNYGTANMLGLGIPENKKAGFELFLKAAEMGYSQAMKNVAMCYELGDGTEKDSKKAQEWRNKAYGRAE